MPAAEFHYNPLGSVHGGVISTLLDTAAACAVHTTLAVGELYTSVDLTAKFLRPVTVDSGLLTCEGTVIQRGRRTALAQAQLTDEAGRLVAPATSTCMIMRAGDWAPARTSLTSAAGDLHPVGDVGPGPPDRDVHRHAVEPVLACPDVLTAGPAHLADGAPVLVADRHDVGARLDGLDVRLAE